PVQIAGRFLQRFPAARSSAVVPKSAAFTLVLLVSHPPRTQGANFPRGETLRALSGFPGLQGAFTVLPYVKPIEIRGVKTMQFACELRRNGKGMLLVALVVGLLAACGGGGNGGSPNPPPTQNDTDNDGVLNA